MESEGEITFGVLTVSDSCYQGKSKDESGPALCKKIAETFENSKIFRQKIVCDDQKLIAGVLIDWCDNASCNIILTTGGTGFAPRDVTPEATEDVIKKKVPGIATVMLMRSLSLTDKAILSRAVCGIRNNTLIINLPGSKKGCVECFTFIASTLPHAVALINDHSKSVADTHRLMQSINNERDAPSKAVAATAGPASRCRKSPYPMKSVSEAWQIITENCELSKETECVRIEDALHRVLAEDIIAEAPLPPFRASIKDGYAVKVVPNMKLRTVRCVIAAGDMPDLSPLKPEQAARISTGAALPDGAEAVVQVEDTVITQWSEDHREEKEIELCVQPFNGQDIREIGSDIAAGSKVLNGGDTISAAHIGVLAAVGRQKTLVLSRKVVGILSTGDELKSHGDGPLTPGQIRDVNKPTLIALLKRFGYTGLDCGTARDEANVLKRAIWDAFNSSDILITTGGVSMGEFDLIKTVLVADFGATVHFARVDMKPGKPTTFATCTFNGKKKLIFGLPGNPASACVTALLFVIPTLRRLEGRKEEFPIISSYLMTPLTNSDSRPSYVRCAVRLSNDKFEATSTGNQISSRINSLVGANALVTIPGNYKNFAPNDTFKTILFDDLIC